MGRHSGPEPHDDAAAGNQPAGNQAAASGTGRNEAGGNRAAASETGGNPQETPARRTGATDRTMAAAAAAAAATAAVAALPPMTSSVPVSGRRARRAGGNPYAPGGTETALTGPVPTQPPPARPPV